MAAVGCGPGASRTDIAHRHDTNLIAACETGWQTSDAAILPEGDAQEWSIAALGCASGAIRTDVAHRHDTNLIVACEIEAQTPHVRTTVG